LESFLRVSPAGSQQRRASGWTNWRPDGQAGPAAEMSGRSVGQPAEQTGGTTGMPARVSIHSVGPVQRWHLCRTDRLATALAERAANKVVWRAPTWRPASQSGGEPDASILVAGFAEKPSNCSFLERIKLSESSRTPIEMKIIVLKI
jgi:hypothetical protein